ncbi:NAD(P)H-dependent oxidoreductase [Paenibacillus mendelii]|uniref:NAD(P)H-dependent oxidoreductase n=1 Tax=Paenibacillus mendelii TaxID=206163 RepID=A0ABV6JB23_9BACL|nr:NAD(P)H-dependent oxidoreductase [Paenibacillus mendelii]MCQ6562982.1 NAD(P)H-dependent oxidoreductase [Paenibacillus mendelii]
MNISAILGHPNKGSFNHAIAETIVETLRNNGHWVNFHDLYEENFNPVVTSEELESSKSHDPLVETHCDEIKQAEGIVIVHPNWWGQPPAMLKGWIDRVIRPGVAYRFDEEDNGGGLPTGLLKARIGVVFNTSNTLAEREVSIFGDPLENIWKSCVFEFCGVNRFDRRMYRVIADSTPEERMGWLQDTKHLINKHFPKE